MIERQLSSSFVDPNPDPSWNPPWILVERNADAQETAALALET